MELESVTIVIPAHNRPNHLRRLLHYYEKVNVKILVTDSSKISFPYLDEFPWLNYYHFPNEQFLRKIKNILEYINTKYVVYCADDDFIVPQGIEKVIHFLERHPDYNSGQGHSVCFENIKKKIIFTPAYIRNFEKDINQEYPSERLIEFRNLYASLLYSVIRTSTFREMYLRCFDGDKLIFKNLFLAEAYFNFYSLIEGKNITLPVFYGAREMITGSARYTTIPLNVLQSSKEYEEEFNGFKNLVINQLISKQKIELDFARTLIEGLLANPKRDHIHPLKRFAINLLNNVFPSEAMNRIISSRYRRKGLKITKGMKSYPCTFSTPEKELIIHHIKN